MNLDLEEAEQIHCCCCSLTQFKCTKHYHHRPDHLCCSCATSLHSHRLQSQLTTPTIILWEAKGYLVSLSETFGISTWRAIRE